MTPKKTRLNNLDATDLKLVKKGLTVAYMSTLSRPTFLRGMVTKVNRGYAYVNWAGGRQNDYTACSSLRVIDL